MSYTQYNIIFALFENNLWIVADPQKKTINTLSVVDFQKLHEETNIYIIFDQRKELLSAGNYVYFDLNHKYAPAIDRITVCYGKSKIEAMIEYFLDERQNDFNAHFNLIDKYRLPLWNIGKTTAHLSATLLGARHKMWMVEDKHPKDVLINQYKNIEKEIGSSKFEAEIDGVNCKFGLGGIHGAREKYNAEGVFYNVDVVSMYPTIMIKDDLLSRSADKTRYKEIYNEKIKCKNKEYEYPLKIVLNATFGAMNEPHSELYDPNRFKDITKFGQLYILDLLEKLWMFDLIQTNTDSILVRLDSSKVWLGHSIEIVEQEFSNICLKWQMRTGLTLSFEKIKKVFQKDVNNYLWITEEDKIKAKGAYTNLAPDYNKQTRIIIRALRDKIAYNKSIAKTIRECEDRSEFMFFANVSDKFDGLYLGSKSLGSAVGVYATNNGEKLTKRNKRSGRLEKVAWSPAKCGTNFEDIDYSWYEEQTKKRLESYGLKMGY